MDANLYEMTCAQCDAQNCYNCGVCVKHINRNSSANREE